MNFENLHQKKFLTKASLKTVTRNKTKKNEIAYFAAGK